MVPTLGAGVYYGRLEGVGVHLGRNRWNKEASRKGLATRDYNSYGAVPTQMLYTTRKYLWCQVLVPDHYWKNKGYLLAKTRSRPLGAYFTVLPVVLTVIIKYALPGFGALLLFNVCPGLIHHCIIVSSKNKINSPHCANQGIRRCDQ